MGLFFFKTAFFESPQNITHKLKVFDNLKRISQETTIFIAFLVLYSIKMIKFVKIFPFLVQKGVIN